MQTCVTNFDDQLEEINNQFIGHNQEQIEELFWNYCNVNKNFWNEKNQNKEQNEPYKLFDSR